MMPPLLPGLPRAASLLASTRSTLPLLRGATSPASSAASASVASSRSLRRGAAITGTSPPSPAPPAAGLTAACCSSAVPRARTHGGCPAAGPSAAATSGPRRRPAFPISGSGSGSGVRCFSSRPGQQGGQGGGPTAEGGSDHPPGEGGASGVLGAAKEQLSGAAQAAKESAGEVVRDTVRDTTREPLKDTMKDAMKEAVSETAGDAVRSARDTAQWVGGSARAALGHPPEPHPVQPPEDKMRSYARFPDVGTLPKDATASRPPGLVRNVWGMEAQRPTYPALTANTHCDVLVVGAGMAGLCIAYQLAKKGKQVVVVEARTRGGGQSGRTSAHIMQWNDDYYGVIECKYGKEGSRHVAESHLAAIDFIERVVMEEGIDCDFSRLEGYLFPHDDKQSTMKTLRDELAACHRAGMYDVQLVDVTTDPRHGKLGQALMFPRSAEFHPLKFINGLAAVLTSKYGVRLHENTRVTDTLDPQVSGQVATSTGATVTARQAVVYATNSPINRNVAVHARQEANRTYMLGLRVPKGSTARANWWSTEDPYHYVRLQPGDVDGNQPYDVLLVGGEDHQTGQYPNKYSDPWAALEAFTRERWPQAEDVIYRWSGQVYEPIDMLGLYAWTR